MSASYNMGSIANELNKVLSDVAEKNIGKESIILQTVSLDILSQTVKNTRVDTGALRNNWQISRNLKNDDKVKKKTYDKTGNTAINKSARAVRRVKPKDTIYIQNNLSYSAEYEQKDKMLLNAVKKVLDDLK